MGTNMFLGRFITEVRKIINGRDRFISDNREFSMLMIFLLIQATVNSDELKHGIDAFNQGYYRIAESYFSNIANEKTFNPEAIDARYYLSRIYEARNELISQISATDFFLQEYPYEKRTSELFDRLVRKFVDIGSFSLAYEYLKNYDYMKVDSTLFWDIAIGLIEQKRDRLADFMLAAMGQTDTVLILRANIADSTVAKERYYQAMSGPEKYIFLAELALDSGDTLKAYDAFLTLDNKEFGQEMKFHYARLNLFFDRANAENYIDQLDNASMLNKKMLLTALYKGKTVKLEPRDDDEYDLFVLCLNQEMAPRCSLGIVDSIGNSDIMITNLDSLRKVYGSCFLFDSIYCERFLNQSAHTQALQLIEPYRNYVNTQHFFRKVRGQYYFYQQDYKRSAIDLIIAGELSPKLNLLLARSLINAGRKDYSLYESILNISKDSLILAEANRDLLSLLFKDREFDRVLEIMPDSETGDTALMRMKICSR